MGEIVIGAIIGAIVRDIAGAVWVMIRTLMIKALIKSARDAALWLHAYEKHGAHHPDTCTTGRCAHIK
jgi:hypothetical protein